jgi:hypothetical protein
MKYNLKPNTPRPLDQCFASVAPGQDARWRHVDEETIDGLEARRRFLQERDNNVGRNE